jgi:hypothetical protein
LSFRTPASERNSLRMRRDQPAWSRE